MTKEEHINYWVLIAEKDWEIAQKLYLSNDFVYCLFFTHLAFEKIAKALWVKNHEDNFPPKTHNIVYILEKSDIHLNDEQKDYLLLLNDFQLESRYPDYKQKIFNICDKQFTDEILIIANKIKLWLHSLI
jgi:HEPN domain-containing protein